MASDDEVDRVIVDRIDDVEDREIHVSLVTVPGHPEFGTYLDIREFVPSRNRYGRGLTVPDTMAVRIEKAAKAARSAAKETGRG